MYIDSLTIAASVVFLIALVVFIRFCVMNACGLLKNRRSPQGDDLHGPHS